MKNGIFLLSLCCLLAACNQSPEEDAFDKYKKLIPLIKLPYLRKCSDDLAPSKLNVPDSMFNKYAPKGASGIIGKVTDTTFYTVIIYSVSGDIEYPVIQTYDMEGSKLNDLGLITGTCCGKGKNCSGLSWGEIEKDMSVNLKDSEWVLMPDVIDSTKMKMGLKYNSEIYRIDSTGHVKLVHKQNRNSFQPEPIDNSKPAKTKQKQDLKASKRKKHKKAPSP